MSSMNRILFETIVKLTQEQLHKFLLQLLQDFYTQDEIIEGDKYIVARGEIPIGLVAHLDTVYRSPVRKLIYDPKETIYWSPEGLGADDRAGVWAIMEILAKGHKPSVFFLHDEERGTLGASFLAEELKILDFYTAEEENYLGWMHDLKYLVEIDRANSMDSVYYSCGNKEFKTYINDFGFVSSFGSFTDIVELSPALDVASVNLSTGYYNQHSSAEYLVVKELRSTIKKIEQMLLRADDVEKFDYQEEQYKSLFSTYKHNDELTRDLNRFSEEKRMWPNDY